MLPMTRGNQPEVLDEAVQVDLDAGLVAVAGGQDDAVRAGMNLENRPERRVELRVHEHDVLAMAEGFQDGVRTELNGAR